MTKFFLQLSSNYADVISEFAIPMVIAIFALAFPLLFQAASRIDDKYNSTLLIKLFRTDWICRWFIYTLLGALICCGLWVLHLPRLIDCGEVLNRLIDNSALILLLVSTIILVVMTICSMWLMYVYYIPQRLFDRLKYQYNKSTKNKSMFFMAISKLMHYAIKKTDSELSDSILKFYSNAFFSYREDKKDKTCIYPDEYYRVIKETNELVYMGSKKETSLFNESDMLGLLIDEHQGTILSEKTYIEIWRGMRQALYYNRVDFIVAYWHKAHQYINFSLRLIPHEYDDNYNMTNQSDVEKKLYERERFLEFHYALGGVLMMKKKYTLINQLTSWTNQTPPKYVLVPETMEEVIEKFMNIEKKESFYYVQKYPFPDISGVNADDIIKMWIKRYIAILFLRQYTLNEHFIYTRTLTPPKPPQTLLEKKKWIKELDTLKKYVDEYLQDKICLNALNMSMLTQPDWFNKNDKPEPNNLIEELKAKVVESAEQTKANQEIDNTKKDKFIQSTNDILSKCFNFYSKQFAGGNLDTKHYESSHYIGRHEILDKMAFAREQDISYVDFDSRTAEAVATEFKNSLPLIFRDRYKTTSYRLKELDVFSAIDQLQIDSQYYTIICVGINLHYFQTQYHINKLKVDTNDEWKYKDIPIKKLGQTTFSSINQSLFILRNEDLPYLRHNPIDDSKQVKYGLKKINSEYCIYTNLIDLNKNSNADGIDYKTIKDEVKIHTKLNNMSQFILACVDVNTEVRCKKNSKCIQIKVAPQFDRDEISNCIDDVKNIWNTK